MAKVKGLKAYKKAQQEKKAMRLAEQREQHKHQAQPATIVVDLAPATQVKKCDIPAPVVIELVHIPMSITKTVEPVAKVVDVVDVAKCADDMITSETTQVVFENVAQRDLEDTDMLTSNTAQLPVSNIANDVYDIHAHRKALEAELYENMESPKERFVRLHRSKNVDAEFQNPDFSKVGSSTQLTRDDIHIKDKWTTESLDSSRRSSISTISVAYSTVSDSDASTAASTIADVVESFSKSKTLSKVSSSNSITVMAPISQDGTININALFAATKDLSSVRTASSEISIARTLESVEHEISAAPHQAKLINLFKNGLHKPEQTTVGIDGAINVAARVLAILSYALGTATPAMEKQHAPNHQGSNTADLQAGTDRSKAIIGVGIEQVTSPASLDQQSQKLKSLLGIGSATATPNPEILTKKLNAIADSKLSPLASIFKPSSQPSSTADTSPTTGSFPTSSWISPFESRKPPSWTSWTSSVSCTRSSSPLSSTESDHAPMTPAFSDWCDTAKAVFAKNPNHTYTFDMGADVPFFQDLTYAQQFYGPACFGDQFGRAWSSVY